MTALVFFANAFKQPSQTGAVAPASRFLAKEMALALQGAKAKGLQLPLVELGPGLGQITLCLPQENLTLVEINSDFCSLLREKFSRALVLNESACTYLDNLTFPVDIVSAIPLINNPAACSIKKSIKEAYRRGVLNKVVTYSYGFKSPFADCGFNKEEVFSKVWLNLPPASVWVYC